MSQEGRAAFSLIQDLLSQSSQLVIMNEEDPLILYTDASTKAIGVLMQVQNGIEKPVIFVSHAIYQATRWGVMDLELYAFEYYVKSLTPYLLGSYLNGLS